MFIEYSKRSKKEQKKADNLVRKSWVITKPITKVIPSKKLYSRKGGNQQLLKTVQNHTNFIVFFEQQLKNVLK